MYHAGARGTYAQTAASFAFKDAHTGQVAHSTPNLSMSHPQPGGGNMNYGMQSFAQDMRVGLASSGPPQDGGGPGAGRGGAGFNANAPSFQFGSAGKPAGPPPTSSVGTYSDIANSGAYYKSGGTVPNKQPAQYYAPTQGQPKPHDMQDGDGGGLPPSADQFYYPTPAQSGAMPPQQSNDYNASIGALTHTATRNPGVRSAMMFFMSENLRANLLKRSALIPQKLQPDDPRCDEMPHQVSHYHSFYPLDDPSRDRKSSVLRGFSTFLYKTISTIDGLPYALLRLESSHTVSNEFAMGLADLWRGVLHPNVVSVREIFVTEDVGDGPTCVFAYDYHPGSSTLEEKYMTTTALTRGRPTSNRLPATTSALAPNPSAPETVAGPPLPENVMWSFAVQIISALRAIHAQGFAARAVTPSKIIITGKNRLRFGSMAVLDVIASIDGSGAMKNVPQYQQEDIVAAGRVLLCLACRSSKALQNAAEELDRFTQHYSLELKNFIITLLAPAQAGYPTIGNLAGLLAGHAFTQIEHLHYQTDMVEADLCKELENGRLFRIMTKLGLINERPEFDMDPSWSETGDRYLLKLFRDYVFHQTYQDGSPNLDLGHVVNCLNKLEVGSEEKIMLMSRDEQSMLVVSYKDLKRCIEQAFNELMHPKETNQGFEDQWYTS